MDIVISTHHTITGVGYLLFWTSFLAAAISTVWQAIMLVKYHAALVLNQGQVYFERDVKVWLALTLGCQGGFVLFITKLLIY